MSFFEIESRYKQILSLSVIDNSFITRVGIFLRGLCLSIKSASYTLIIFSSNLTSWAKALDFSGSNEHLKQVGNYSTTCPLRMNDYATNIAAPTTPGYTAYGSSVRPWATAIVFKTDGNNSNQHIWNQGEGAGTGDDNIYVRLSSSGQLYFGWGREGDGKNECLIGGTSNNRWYGLYIGHNGRRMSSSDATAVLASPPVLPSSVSMNTSPSLPRRQPSLLRDAKPTSSRSWFA